MPAAFCELFASVPTYQLLRLIIRSVTNVANEDEPLTKLAMGWGQLGVLASICGLGIATGALVWQTARAELLGMIVRGAARRLIVRLLLVDVGLSSVLVLFDLCLTAEVRTIGYVVATHLISIAFSTTLAFVALRRRGPLRLNGTSAIVGATVAVLAITLIDTGSAPLEALRTLCMSAGGILFFLSLGSIYAREQHASPDREALPSVLYLRAFAHESAYCAHPTRGPLPFDDFIAADIRAQIGPFVGLGNPADPIAVRGAFRRYASDHDWQQEFAKSLARAAAILVVPGPSANLAWELDAVVAAGLAPRLFVLTPPKLAPAQLSRTFRVVLWVAERFGIPRAAEPRVAATDEQDFIASLRARGFSGLPDTPPAGSVLAFDEQRATIVLTQNQHEPSAFAWAIRGRLESLHPLPTAPLSAPPGPVRRSVWYWIAHAYEQGLATLHQLMRRPVLSYLGYLVFVFVFAFVSQLFRQCAGRESDAQAPMRSTSRALASLRHRSLESRQPNCTQHGEALPARVALSLHALTHQRRRASKRSFPGCRAPVIATLRQRPCCPLWPSLLPENTSGAGTPYCAQPTFRGQVQCLSAALYEQYFWNLLGSQSLSSLHSSAAV